MTYNDVRALLERLGIEKHIRAEITASVGLTDVINEDRMMKLERKGLLTKNIWQVWPMKMPRSYHKK